MRAWPATRWFVGLLLAVALAAVLTWTFRTYQNPAHIAQWLSVLQLCR
jgi:hypothetical protein